MTVHADQADLQARPAGGNEGAGSAAWTRYEKAILQLDMAPAVALDIARSWRRARLDSQSDSAIVPAVAGAIGPLFVAFVAWVLERAREEGVSRLYFVARDGQVLYEIAKELIADGEGPELSYLYGSRQAWYLPSVEAVTPTDLHFVLDRANSLSPADNLQKLHLSPEDIGPVLERHGLSAACWSTQLDDDQIEMFWRAVFDPEVACKIEENAATARESAVGYFKQEGLLDHDRWALVDIGWGLGAQASLRRILSSVGQEHVLGYYLAIGEARTSPFDHGQARGFLVEERDYGQRYPGRATLFDDKGLVDQVFTVADHGRTLGYERQNGRYVPILDDETLSQDERELMVAVRSTVTNLARMYREHGLSGERVDEVGQAARRAIELFLARPRRSEVEAIRWYPVVYDHNDSTARTVPLAARLKLTMVFQIIKTVLARLGRGGKLSSGGAATPTALKKDLSWGFSWLAGSASLSSPVVRLAVTIFRRLNRRVSRGRAVGRSRRQIVTTGLD